MPGMYITGNRPVRPTPCIFRERRAAFLWDKARKQKRKGAQRGIGPRRSFPLLGEVLDKFLETLYSVNRKKKGCYG